MSKKSRHLLFVWAKDNRWFRWISHLAIGGDAAGAIASATMPPNPAPARGSQRRPKRNARKGIAREKMNADAIMVRIPAPFAPMLRVR